MSRTLVLNRAISAWTLLLLACSQPSETDKQHLHLLQQRFGQKFEFALEGDLYLKARLRDASQPTEAELREIYKVFVLDDDGRRRETPVVYLNVYDSDGRFQKQLAYDFSSKRFVESKTEHY